MSSDMLPQSTINDAGNSVVGTPYGGPFTGPDPFSESGLTFLDVTRQVVLKDAISVLAGSASPPVQQHAYLISKGTLQNVIAVIYSNQINPSLNQRIVPKLKFAVGDKVYIRAVQMSEASTAAAEPSTLILSWSPV